jgi:predicted permease
MDIFITSFESVAVLLVIGFLGFWIIKRDLFPGTVLKFLSPLAIDIALPCLVFFSIITNFSPEKTAGWWQLPICWLLFTAVSFPLSIIAGFVSQKNTRSEFTLSLFYQNGIFLPLVIIGGLFGDNSAYLVYLFLFTMFFPGFFFSTYHFFFGKKDHFLNWKKIVNPVLIASLVAVFIRYVGAHDYIPRFIISSIRLVGGMAIPSLLIIIGGNIYIDFQKKGTLYIREVMKFVFIKNLLFPLVFFSILILLRPSYSIALIILLESAVPPITAVPIVTERAGGNYNIVNQFVVASFVFSLFSISLMVMLFSMYFTP